jgi:hypothetical protein
MAACTALMACSISSRVFRCTCEILPRVVNSAGVAQSPGRAVRDTRSPANEGVGGLETFAPRSGGTLEHLLEQVAFEVPNRLNLVLHAYHPVFSLNCDFAQLLLPLPEQAGSGLPRSLVLVCGHRSLAFWPRLSARPLCFPMNRLPQADWRWREDSERDLPSALSSRASAASGSPIGGLVAGRKPTLETLLIRLLRAP